jgi:hypothetical protein
LVRRQKSVQDSTDGRIYEAWWARRTFRPKVRADVLKIT